MTCKRCGKDHSKGGKNSLAFGVTKAVNDLFNDIPLDLKDRILAVEGLKQQLKISVEEWNKYNKSNKKLVISKKFIEDAEKIMYAKLEENNYREKLREEFEKTGFDESDHLSYVS